MPIERIVIENPTPVVDGGRHPAKRLVGETCEVGADIFKDGHDLIQARIAFRTAGERGWQRALLQYRYDPDRWFGAFELDRLGRWEYTIEAWPDLFGTWRDGLAKRIATGQDVTSELLEGAGLLRRYAERARAAERRALEAVAATLGDADLPPEERSAAAETLATSLARPLEPGHVTRYRPTLPIVVDRERASFGAWYEMFPRSQAQVPGRHGTFADAERRLPELAELGFDVVYLPPIHPIGVSRRRGRNNAPHAETGDPGSPWAIGTAEGGHTAVHPDLGTLADFERFVKVAESLGLEVALDYALQCSADHPWLREHPDWFFRRPDGTLHFAENPPKKYEDIYPLDFWCEDRERLWEGCREVLHFWIDRGVRIFRVDNPHTKPYAFWEWLLEEIRREHPDVIFLSEAFTRPKRMLGLAKLGFGQSYTYFTWKNTSWELRELMSDLTSPELVEYYRPNFFANTPDILHAYLQRGGPAAFRVRLLLAATLSPSYGIYSGFELCENVPLRENSEEYLNSEKYEIRVRDWDAPGNLKADIARLNRIRRKNPALQRLANLRLLETSNEQILAYVKRASGNRLIAVVNLDPRAPQEGTVSVPAAALGLDAADGFAVEDLLSGERYRWSPGANFVRLDPARRVGHLLRVVE